MNKTAFIVLGQKIEEREIRPHGNEPVFNIGPHFRDIVHVDFLHQTEEAAKAEIADRSARLAAAINSKNAMAKLSISKEHNRKLQGFSKANMAEYAKGDEVRYQQWLQKAKDGWKAKTGVEPSEKTLDRAFQNFDLLKDLLGWTEGFEFSEILSQSTELATARPKTPDPEIEP